MINLARIECFENPVPGMLHMNVQSLSLSFHFEVLRTMSSTVFEHRLNVNLIDQWGNPITVDVRQRDKVLHLAYDFTAYRAQGVTDLKYDIELHGTVYGTDASSDWQVETMNVRLDDEIVKDSGAVHAPVGIFPGAVQVSIHPHYHPKQYVRKLSFSAVTRRTKADGNPINATSFSVDPIIIIAPKRP